LTLIAYNTAVVLAGAIFLGACAGFVGSFAVLQRRALLGDALAHAALPGVCLGFLVAGERSLIMMLAGALCTGLLGIVIISFVTRFTRVRLDAAIGIILSVFFGAGVVLSRSIQNMKSITSSKAGLDSFIMGKTAGMTAQDVYFTGACAVVSLILAALLFKEFFLVSFDPGFARVQGWPVRRIDLILTFLIALIVVIGLQSVGVVMIAALLIIPGATARFWSDRLSTLVILSSGLGIAMGFVGTLLSAKFSMMPAGPVICLVGTAFFAVSVLTAPKRGIVVRLIRRHRERWNIACDELLRQMCEASEICLKRVNIDDSTPFPTSKQDPIALDRLTIARSMKKQRFNRLIMMALKNGDIEREDDTLRLTPQGSIKARELTRRLREWMALLDEHPEMTSQPFGPWSEART
jgi:manganese/zinc/iron transport system permease protein